MPECEVTVLMPCLDEARTLAGCIQEARAALERHRIDGEVLIADNGSTDGSPQIALAAGASVIHVAERGYGSALRGGIDAARGKYVVMGDADGSYDFGEIPRFVEKLRQGYDLVMGNRFRGTILPGAMPWLHRYIGNPALSGIGRLLFGNPCGDFHCGLRAFRREAALSWGLRCCGMEFATEVVVRAVLHGAKIAELPITLRPDGRGRAPHLQSFRDGWRHLRFMLQASCSRRYTERRAASRADGLGGSDSLSKPALPRGAIPHRIRLPRTLVHTTTDR
jgi:glycosyltransferase involved in cell wall biosynthesis